MTFILTPLIGWSRGHTAVQSQQAVSAYFTSKQILPFAFAEQSTIFGAYRAMKSIFLYFTFCIIFYLEQGIAYIMHICIIKTCYTLNK